MSTNLPSSLDLNLEKVPETLAKVSGTGIGTDFVEQGSGVVLEMDLDKKTGIEDVQVECLMKCPAGVVGNVGDAVLDGEVKVGSDVEGVGGDRVVEVEKEDGTGKMGEGGGGGMVEGGLGVEVGDGVIESSAIGGGNAGLDVNVVENEKVLGSPKKLEEAGVGEKSEDKGKDVVEVEKQDGVGEGAEMVVEKVDGNESGGVLNLNGGDYVKIEGGLGAQVVDGGIVESSPVEGENVGMDLGAAHSEKVLGCPAALEVYGVGENREEKGKDAVEVEKHDEVAKGADIVLERVEENERVEVLDPNGGDFFRTEGGLGAKVVNGVTECSHSGGQNVGSDVNVAQYEKIPESSGVLEVQGVGEKREEKGNDAMEVKKQDGAAKGVENVLENVDGIEGDVVMNPDGEDCVMEEGGLSAEAVSGVTESSLITAENGGLNVNVAQGSPGKLKVEGLGRNREEKGNDNMEVEKQEGITVGVEMVLEKVDENESAGVSNLNCEDRVMVEEGSGAGVVNGVTESIPVGDENLGSEIGRAISKQISGEDVKEAGSLPVLCRGDRIEVKQLKVCSSAQVDENGKDGGHDRVQNIEPTEFDQLKGTETQSIERRPSKHGVSSMNKKGASYCLATEKEGKFAIHDMVWGKVRSHPWWPGQIFDPSVASEKAMKLRKKGRFLIAYFGDQSFAWNEASSLKPFKMHFSRMEKQSNTDAFLDAVNCALDEVSRRVEFGLSCSCTPQEANTEIKPQTITNSGIRDDVRRKECMDRSLSAASFEPEKLVEYVAALASYPGGGADRLELAIARAQLESFYRSKGYFQMPKIHVYEGLLTDDVLPLQAPKLSCKASSQKRKLKSQDSSSLKRRRTVEDGLDPRKRERSLTDLMEREDSVPSSSKNITGRKEIVKSAVRSSGKKHKTREVVSNDSVTKKRDQEASPSVDYVTQSSKLPGVGERMSRIASQMTGAPSVLKYTGDRFGKGVAKVDRSSRELQDSDVGSSGKLQDVDVDFTPNTPQRYLKQLISTPKEHSSPEKMLSQLCLIAENPMRRNSFRSVVVEFFTDFRNSVCLDQSSFAKDKKSLKRKGSGVTGVRNKKSLKSKTSDENLIDSPEEQPPEEQPSHQRKKRKVDLQLGNSSEDGHNSECKSTQLNPTLDSKNDTSSVVPEECFQQNPTTDSQSENQNENSNLVSGKTIGNCKDAGKFSGTALILNFNKADSIPLETELNKIFSRYGPLKESETEILMKTSKAKVVFERRNDAEVAFSSAGKFSIFGPALQSYQLKYLPLAPTKASPSSTRKSKEDATSLQSNTS